VSVPTSTAHDANDAHDARVAPGTGAAAPSAARSPRRGRPLAGVLAPLGVAAAVVGLWYVATYLLLASDRRFLLPPFHEVVGAAVSAPTAAEILAASWRTTQVAALGLAIAFVLGFTVAVAMSQARWVERSLYPWAVFSQTVPILAIVPLLGFWFGYGWVSRVVVCVVIALFPIIVNTLEGLRSADRQLHDLLTLAGAGRRTRLRVLQLPAAVPDILVGLRTSAGLAVTGAIVGDLFFGRGQAGLGLLISRYGSRLQSAEMLAATIAACALGVAAFALVGWVGRRLTGHWDQRWEGTVTR